MSEGIKDTKETKQTTPVVRRGIGNDTRGTTRLKFDTRDASPNGFFLGHLESVDVKEITIGEDTTGMPSFNGLSIPKLMFVFTSNDSELNKRRYVTLSFNAVESNTLTIPGGKEEWKVNQIFDYIKHILNVYILKGREMTQEEEAALSLDFVDFDDNGEYVPVDVESVIKGWKNLFTNFTTWMNTARDGSPAYKTKDNKDIPIWMKLLRHIKNPKKGWAAVNNGELGFPSFVGEGVIEIFKQGVPPMLRLDAAKESIKVRTDVEAKAPNMGTPPMGAIPNFVGGVPLGNTNIGVQYDAGVNNMAVEDDMPF